MTTYDTPEARIAHMVTLTGMTEQEIADYTNRVTANEQAVWQAKQDGATDAELLAIAARR